MATKKSSQDDTSTRVGRPSKPHKVTKTGVGNEAAEGIRRGNKGGVTDRPGSEPLAHRKEEHASGYGGKGGAPNTSSDQR
jgi:hypothetical protein